LVPAAATAAAAAAKHSPTAEPYPLGDQLVTRLQPLGLNYSNSCCVQHKPCNFVS
jgi:hypothetical protein